MQLHDVNNEGKCYACTQKVHVLKKTVRGITLLVFISHTHNLYALILAFILHYLQGFFVFIQKIRQQIEQERGGEGGSDLFGSKTI